MSAMRVEDIRRRLQAVGAKPGHEQRVLRHWAHALPLTAGRRRIEDFLPLALRQALPQLISELAALARLQSGHAGDDGSERLLLQLAAQMAQEEHKAARNTIAIFFIS